MPLTLEAIGDSPGAGTAHGRCYSHPIPTTRPRHSITETPEVAAAIDQARGVFPEADSRAAVLLELIRLGADEVERRRQSDEEEHADRRQAVRELSQMCSGEIPGMDVALLQRVREEAWRE